MESKPIRRVVVGHDPQGKAVAVFDGDVAPKQRSPGGNGVANLWITGEFPASSTFRLHRPRLRLRMSTTIRY